MSAIGEISLQEVTQTNKSVINENAPPKELNNHPTFQYYKNLESVDVASNSIIKPNLTGYTLFGEDKIIYRSPSFSFASQAEDSANFPFSITFFHLGSKLSGHPGIIHGGLIATLLDELTCGVAFMTFESGRGVTANLNVNYRRPALVDSFILVRCAVSKKEGRKCWVKGSVYKMDTEEGEDVESPSNLLTEAEVLVIEPKWVDKLSSQTSS